MPLSVPILKPQLWHPLKFRRIVSDQGHLSRYRLPSYQYLVGSDRRPLGKQKSSNLASSSGIFLVELKHFKLKRIHDGYVLHRPPAFERTIEQLMSDYRGDRYVGGILQSHRLCWL